MKRSSGPAANDETATETTSRPASKSKSDGSARAARVRVGEAERRGPTGSSGESGNEPRRSQHTKSDKVKSAQRSAPFVTGARSSGLYADVAGMLDGTLPEPPAPTILATEGGYSLFYEGQVNLIFGDPECGKTWLALCAAAECLTVGGTVLVLDLDHNGATSTVARLLGMGVPVDVLRDPQRFRYAEPEDRLHLDNVVADSKVSVPHIAVVDSIGELLPPLGLNSSSPDDFTVAHSRVLKPLAMAGAGVLAIDHLPKGADSRASGPTGTAAKRRAVGGVSIRVTVRDQFVPSRGGCAGLGINKDRHGGLRQHVLADGREPSAGLFYLDSSGDKITWRITTPQQGEALTSFSGNSEDIAAVAALVPPPTSQRDVQDRMSWGGTRALDALRGYRSGSATGAPGAPPPPTALRSAPPVFGARSTAGEQPTGKVCPDCSTPIKDSMARCVRCVIAHRTVTRRPSCEEVPV